MTALTENHTHKNGFLAKYAINIPSGLSTQDFLKFSFLHEDIDID